MLKSLLIATLVATALSACSNSYCDEQNSMSCQISQRTENKATDTVNDVISSTFNQISNGLTSAIRNAF